MAKRMGVAGRRRFDSRELRRVGLWGLAATAALVIAVFATTTEMARNRLSLVASKVPVDIPEPPAPEPRIRPEDEAARRFAASLQMLIADRDRLAARLDTLERNVGEITGSIGRLAAAPPVAQPPAPAPPEPAPAIAAPDVQEPTAPLQTTPIVPAEPNRHEIGIDLGGAANMQGLRALWITTKAKHGSLLEGLHPVMTIRERARGVELRLVVGPLGNTATATRLCSVFARTGAVCQPAPFEGQQLAWR